MKMRRYLFTLALSLILLTQIDLFATDWLTTGNTLGGDGILGLNDEYSLDIKTDGNTRINISSNGIVTIDKIKTGSSQFDELILSDQNGVLNVVENFKFFPDKRGIRMGKAWETQWNYANIGTNSVAIGSNCIANGDSAFAFGNSCEASARGAFASGTSSTASGISSIVIGTLCKASENPSMAIGKNNSVYGAYSIALGNDNFNTGYQSCLIGYDNFCSGTVTQGYAFGKSNMLVPGTDIGGVIGCSNTISASGWVLGDYNIVSGLGNSGYILGTDNHASGARSFAIGQGLKATADFSMALGYYAESSHTGSVVISGVPPQVYPILPIVTSSCNNQLTMKFTGGSSTITSQAAYRLFTNNAETTGMYMAPGESGWRAVSDKNKKENIQSIKENTILESILKIPVSTWVYKKANPDIRYIGPMSQDFTKEFPYGNGDRTSINSIIMDGVLFAGVKALAEKTIVFEKKQEELISTTNSLVCAKQACEKIEQLEKENTELNLRLEMLEDKINKLLDANSNIVDCYEDIRLEQNIPNPFDGTTEIICTVPSKYSGIVKLVIAAGTGSRIYKKIDLQFNIENTIVISAKDYDTGAYLYGVELNGTIVKSKKMLVIK